MILLVSENKYLAAGFEYIFKELRRYAPTMHNYSHVRFGYLVADDYHTIIVDFAELTLDRIQELIKLSWRYPRTKFIVLTGNNNTCNLGCLSLLSILQASFWKRKKMKFLLNRYLLNIPIRAGIQTEGNTLSKVLPLDQLTRRQRDILPYILAGYNNKQIAVIFRVDNKTIYHHRLRIYHLCHSRNQTDFYRNLFSKEKYNIADYLQVTG